MKIDNRTHWNTQHLRAIIARVAATELDPNHRRQATIRVVYGRSRGSSGVAYVGSSLAVVRIASGNPTWRMKHGVPELPVDKVDFAGTVAHEMAHLRGMKHAWMRGCPRYRRVEGHKDLYAWAEAMPLERQAAKSKPALDERRQQRLAHARTMLVAWERKAKIAAGRVRRWRGRVRDYERYLQLAAAQPPKAGAS